MLRKLFIGFLAVVLGIVGVAIVLASEHAVVFHPKGMIAKNILAVILTNIFLMLVIIVPTYLLLFLVFWKYALKENVNYDTEHKQGPLTELIMWILPTIVVVIMAFVTWGATHELNPYKPIENDKKPLTVQVVALNWKWLFIYPELGIATLNYLHIPVNTPIHFQLAADHSPMNSFWIPQLSGQIYAMAGMNTQLYLMADHPGEYVGRAVEINGEGYANMTFPVKSTSQKEFDEWIKEVKRSSNRLTQDLYNELTKFSIDRSKVFFSDVEKDLYQKIIHKYMYPTKPVL